MSQTPENKYIVIRGARQHNLQDIDLDIPRNRLVVITGPSGSGKSSHAFDTIYAEGQRRYVESLSTYARQFLDLMEKPDVDRIDGLSPALAIEQRGHTRSRRSTVGTVTEIYDHLRLLFARAGQPHCPGCGNSISRQSVQEMVDAVLALPERTRLQILAPLVKQQKGTHKEALNQLRKDGYVRVRVDGEVRSLDEDLHLDAALDHSVEAVVDRLISGPQIARRLADSIETTLRISGGLVTIDILEDRELTFSTRFACADCDLSFEEMEPNLFSFNSPKGACPNCEGLGSRLEIDEDRIVPNPELSISNGAIAPWGVPKGNAEGEQLQRLADHFQFRISDSFSSLPVKARKAILHGSRSKALKFDGIIPALEKQYRDAPTDETRAAAEAYMKPRICQACSGHRLNGQSLSVRIENKNIAEVTGLTVTAASHFFETLPVGDTLAPVVRPILTELKNRLSFLQDVGVGYLTLDRNASTLSGGEAQRIRLATQIGSRLSGVLYVLDEPSIGLHARDNQKLIKTLIRLRNLGNTVLVVEHDRDTMRAADHLIDLGPGAGDHGGRVIAQGTPEEIAQNEDSLTGAYLSRRKHIPLPPDTRTRRSELTLSNARGHNLKSVDVTIPLGLFLCVTGVSGSGKSTLINQTLYPALARHLHRSKLEPLEHDEIKGLGALDKVIRIDQTPIGRTPRSNPATYTDLFTIIRDLFAQLPESKVRGYAPGRFSFNVKGGRCEVCQGEGVKRIEMHFLPDVYVTCDACHGKRYNRETLEVTYKGSSIADVLEMTVDRALTFFKDIPQAQRRLNTLMDVGLGYIRLGQPATSLSGGEAQRIKLASELSRVATGNTIYILDEPTTGLHFEDIRILIGVLDRLVEKGNTVLVIEHNMDVIKRADWIIDMGPEGGEAGGSIIAQGPPDEIARASNSYTGQYLKKELAS